MKKVILIAASVSLLFAVVGCLEQGGGSGSYKGPLVRYHFGGRAAIGKDGTATVLKRVEGLKETTTLRTHFAQRLGAAAVELWKADLPAGAGAQPELLRPLLEDLMTSEALVEIHGPVGRTETLIAVDLSDDRARLWDTNLVQLARAWKLGTPTPAVVEGIKGWGVRRPQAPVLQVFRAGKWTILGLGPDQMPAVTSALQAVTRSGRPMVAPNGILDVQADLPGLRKWFPILAQFPLAPVELSMVGRGDNVRTELRMMYASRIPWKFEPWQIPTNLVSEPLTSFTLAQGVRPFLERFEGLRMLGVPLPNQYCSWGAFHRYGHTFFAFPYSGASNTVARLFKPFQEANKLYFDTPLGQFNYLPNQGELVWGGGVPGITPTLSSSTLAGQEFIHGRLFPLLPNRKPAPPELYSQFRGRTNLVYYDWESTSNRVVVARQLYQLGNIFNRRPTPALDTPSQKWLEAIGPLLENTVTEITATAPQEMLLTRKSQVGFTGFELATLAAWVESPGFPQRIERRAPFKLDKTKRPSPGPGAAPKQ